MTVENAAHTNEPHDFELIKMLLKLYKGSEELGTVSTELVNEALYYSSYWHGGHWNEYMEVEEVRTITQLRITTAGMDYLWSRIPMAAADEWTLKVIQGNTPDDKWILRNIDPETEW